MRCCTWRIDWQDYPSCVTALLKLLTISEHNICLIDNRSTASVTSTKWNNERPAIYFTFTRIRWGQLENSSNLLLSKLPIKFTVDDKTKGKPLFYPQQRMSISQLNKWKTFEVFSINKLSTLIRLVTLKLIVTCSTRMSMTFPLYLVSAFYHKCNGCWVNLSSGCFLSSDQVLAESTSS